MAVVYLKVHVHREEQAKTQEQLEEVKTRSSYMESQYQNLQREPKEAHERLNEQNNEVNIYNRKFSEADVQIIHSHCLLYSFELAAE